MPILPTKPGTCASHDPCLFSLAHEYSHRGPHRTGTATHKCTQEWLCSLFADDFDVALHAYPYQHYEAEVCLHDDLDSITCMALYYSYTGNKTLINYDVIHVHGHAEEALIHNTILDASRLAKSNNKDGLVVISQCPVNSLCAINSDYHLTVDLPVVVMAESDGARLQQVRPAIHFKANCRAEKAHNIIVRTSSHIDTKSQRQLLITTPFSGWFNCAGERGAGLAIAIQLAKQLKQDFQLTILLTSGHELGCIGVQQVIHDQLLTPQAIVHIGSCVGNLDSLLTVNCRASDQVIHRVQTTIGDLSDTFNKIPANERSALWQGESAYWDQYKLPMLSVAGLSDLFHTPDDIAVRAFNNSSLEAANKVLKQTIYDLLGE